MFREKEFVLGMLRQSTTWGRENRVRPPPSTTHVMKYLMALIVALLVPTAAMAEGECQADRQKFCAIDSPAPGGRRLPYLWRNGMCFQGDDLGSG